MTGIPTVTFDYFNLAEIPTFILCNPNKEQLYALGGISERKYNAKFNALSELSFRADEYVNGIQMPYYDHLVHRKLIFIEDIGYFMITGAPEQNDGIVKYKEVECESLETQLSSKKLVIYISGSAQTADLQDPIPVTLHDLLCDLIENYIPEWNMNEIYVLRPASTLGPEILTGVPPSIRNKYRSFDITDKSIYDFLMTDVEDAYGCVFDFDTENQLINIYTPEEVISTTDIYISHNNLIESMEINEVTDELATCIYAHGGGDMGIIYVNPLGNNYIYNFEYFENTNWMSQSLIDSLNLWEEKVTSASPYYASRTESLYLLYDGLETLTLEYNKLTGSLAALETAASAIRASGGDTTAIEEQIVIVSNWIYEYWYSIQQTNAQIGYLTASLQTTIEELSFETNFSANQIIELQPFIIQSSYINENIIQTDNMSSASIMQYSYSLYYQAQDVLAKISEPKYTFEIDSINFMNIESFQTFRNQIVLGSSITIETREGTSTSAILLSMEIGFDDPTDFKLIFGNRLRMDDEAYKFKDIMSRAINAGNSNRVYSSQWNSFSRNYQDSVENILVGVKVEDTGYREGMYINTGDSINLITPNLLWNNYPIASYFGGGSGSGITEIKITLFSGGISTTMYDPTATGLNAAIAASVAGDVIFLPDVEITGDFSIPAGVNLAGVSSRESIIYGQVTMEPLCLLENLTVLNQQNTTSPIYAVIVNETTATAENSKIKGCELYAYQCGSGSAVAVYIPNSNVSLTVENSTVVADSNDGLAYAFATNTESFCNVLHSGYYAKTEVFHDL